MLRREVPTHRGGGHDEIIFCQSSIIRSSEIIRNQEAPDNRKYLPCSGAVKFRETTKTFLVSRLQTMANYDPVAALDFEKRLGIEKGDIDDFLRKVLLDRNIHSFVFDLSGVSWSFVTFRGVTTILIKTHAQLGHLNSA